MKKGEREDAKKIVQKIINGLYVTVWVRSIVF